MLTVPGDSFATGQARINTSSTFQKTNHRLRIGHILMICGALLLPFDDLALLGGAGGSVTRSVGWVFFVTAAFLFPRPQSESVRIVEKWILRLWLYGVLVTAMTLPLLPEVARGEPLLFKALKVAVMFSCFALSIRAGLRAACWSPRCLVIGALCSVAIMTFSAMIDLSGSQLLDANSFIHNTSNYAQRVRGTRFEASSLGAGLLVCLATALLFVKRKRFLLLAAFVFFGVTLLTQSRGTLVVVSLAIISCIVPIFIGKGTVRQKSTSSPLWGLAFIALSLVLAFGLGFLVTSSAWEEMSASTSDATRSIWSETAFNSLLAFPFGQGYGGPTYWLGQLFKESLQNLSSVFPTKALGEAFAVSRSTSDGALSPKTFLAMVAVYFGLPGLILTLIGFWRVGGASVSRTSLGFPLYIPAAVIFVSVTSSYYSSPFAWEQAVLLGALLAQATAYTEKDFNEVVSYRGRSSLAGQQRRTASPSHRN